MKSPKPVQERSPRELRDAALLGLGAASAVACMRGVMSVLGRGFLDESVGIDLLVRVARHAGQQLGFTLIFFLGLCLAAIALRRRKSGLRFAPPVAAFYAFFSWALITLRLPTELHTHPSFETTTGMIANGAAALASLTVVTIVMFGLFAPEAARKPVLLLRRGGLLLLVAILATRAFPMLSQDEEQRPNVLLISIDTLRPDHLPTYGYGRNTAPNLDAFAKQALRFDHAFTNHPWTLTAHATMMTGMTPSAHGVNAQMAMDPRIPTVAGLLNDEGYQTFAVVDNNNWLDPQFGYSGGFERYKQMDTDAGPKVHELLESIDDARAISGKPFFAFAHFYDVHSDWKGLPYESDAEDMERFAGNYTGDFTGCDDEGNCASRYMLDLNGKNERLSEADLEYVRDLYDAGIATLDRRLGVLFAGLEERGLFENTIVIVTADHGEEFGEHGKMLHGQHFDECLRVPLMIRSPRGPHDQVNSEMVGLVDLASTMLQFGGVEVADLETLQGRSLAPLLETGMGSLAPGHPLLSDSGSGVFGLRTKDYSYFRWGKRPNVYDLKVDPEQRQDIRKAGTAEPGVIDDLATQMRLRATESLGLRKLYSERTPIELPEAAKANLAKLGYTEGVTE